MHRRLPWSRLLLLLGLWLPLALPLAARESAPLQFRISEGRTENAFYQHGATAAHLLLTSGDKPRVLVAFPAGNSGVGLWFEDAAATLHWDLASVSERVETLQGKPWRGIRADASVNAPRLVVRDAVLGSVRVLRDYQLLQKYPPETAATPRLHGRSLRWQRQRLDGAPGYALEVTALNGSWRQEGDRWTLQPEQTGQPLRLRIDALTGETPLTPFAATHLLNDQASNDLRSRQALQFLSYHEKFLAGSWRFDTYFGRDTLMSLRLLMPALQPQAVESGLGSVLARLSAGGEVAHEEDIGEFAVLRHRKENGGNSATPVFDYAMVDDDFMLPPVTAAWLLEDPRGRARAAQFLATGLGGERQGDALVRNLLFVAGASADFAREPVARHLIALKPGRDAGQWRDSNEGIGRGRYPYDVNAVWMPASLRAMAGLLDSGLLQPYLSASQQQTLREAGARAALWEREASRLFAVERGVATARHQVGTYAASLGVPAPAPATQSLRFHAIALDGEGRPIPILHSDEGFRLLFGQPDAAQVGADVAALLQPFPAGLMTDAGMVVANPAYADAGVWPRFSAHAYHGTVIWAWQQAVMAAGLQRQLARTDLSPATRQQLQTAQSTLWRAIHAADAVRTSELWSWTYRDGRYQVEPFGAQGAHEDESNAAQLWSTVFLALSPPPEIKTEATP
ncbi:hypothetical protein [Pseudoxanthomonas indica]|uniref:Glycogen debranching enzyme n=1 Tax=Pseudoxanthomonas indica TaxID=428993 RepID=A0A1T5K5V9_9GAMM|nr:hypothetical protein [Pseudoxanthomonas indica]GGD46937.1 lipoprotein [Pseudoxanthomonas indica]SKC59004.1 hypothetical protein SAMN06296058_1390 [Pseudoxanthomonas indica]